MPYLDGERLSGCVWESRGVFDDRGEGLVGLPHPISLGVLVRLPHTVLRVGLPHKLCGISIAVIDIAVTGITVTGIAVTGSAVTSLAGGHPAASAQHRLSAEDESGAVDLDVAA